MKTFVAAALLAGMLAGHGTLTGCSTSSGLGEAMSYSATTNHLTLDGVSYRIFEHPSKDRIMVTPSIGKGVGSGLAEGVTLGGASSGITAASLRPAARKWLDDSGRANCQITSSKEVVKWQYAYIFKCA